MKHLFSLVLPILLCTAVLQAQHLKQMGKEVGFSSVPMSGSMQVNATDILVEGFNDTTTFPPPGWIMINRDGNVHATDTAWYQSRSVGGVGSLPPYEGAALAAGFFGSANGLYIDDYLITPNTGGTAPPGSVDSLIFWLTSRRSSSGDYPDSLDIRVSTTGRNANDFTLRLDYVLAPKARWTRFAYALPIAPVRYIAFRYLIYNGGATGANSDKVCLDAVRITRFGSSAVGTGETPADRYELLQNYPNPFNPTTTIAFTLKHTGKTTLTVYNMLGEVVAQLLDQELTAGYYTIPFNAATVPSGGYYYRLASASFAATKAMIVLK